MKILFTALICLASWGSFAQNAKAEFNGAHWNAPYTFAIPFGWGVERSLIQKESAIQVKLIGVEDIRYSPGWGNSSSEQYWSYGFLWYLDETPIINEEVLERNINSHYTSLLETNIEKQKVSARKILPVKTWITEIASENDDLKTFYGAVAMLDYMDQKPISLNCIVHLKSSTEQNKTFLFFEVSPQPLNDKIWGSLDQLWLDFRMTASEHKPRLNLKTYFLPKSIVGGGQ